MRTSSTLISGAVAAVAMATSANAAIVDFNGISVPSNPGWVQVSPATYGGFVWGGDLEVMNQSFWNSNYGSGSSGFSGNIAYHGADMGSDPITATWAGAASVSLDSLVIGKVWPNIGGFASSSVIVKGFKNSVEVASQTITLTGSVQTIAFSAGFADIDSFSLGAGSGGQYFYFDSFTYTAVPAPGAIALLGAAGLVGARRRR